MAAYEEPSAIICSCGERFKSAWSVNNDASRSKRLRRRRLPAVESALWLFLRHRAARLASHSGESRPHSAARVLIRCAICLESINIDHYRRHLTVCTVDDRQQSMLSASRASDFYRWISESKSSAQRVSFECRRCLECNWFQRLDVASLIAHSTHGRGGTNNNASLFELYLSCQCGARVPLSDAVGHAAYWHPDRLRSGLADLFVDGSTSKSSSDDLLEEFLEMHDDSRRPSPVVECDNGGASLVFDAADLMTEEVGSDQPKPTDSAGPNTESKSELHSPNLEPSLAEITRRWPLFECDVCASTFHKQRDLLSHAKNHVSQHPFHCRYCDSNFMTGSLLHRHWRVRHTETGALKRRKRAYRCTVAHCDKAFSAQDKLDEHMRHHTGERPFACPYDNCSVACVSKMARNSHVALKHGVGRFKCTECDVVCAYKNYLSRHMLRRHTPLDKLPFACDHCDKRFISPDRLNNHKLVHSEARPFACQQCDKAFKSANNLQHHLKVHSEERPFRCELCGKAYKTKVPLIVHCKSFEHSQAVAAEERRKGAAVNEHGEATMEYATNRTAQLS